MSVKQSVCHQDSISFFYKDRFPDGKVTFSTYDNENILSCDYCGSLHPTDALELLEQGAKIDLADMKYGWPHKVYIRGENTRTKFYTVHLQDATPEEKDAIEHRIGIRFEFDGNSVKWQRFNPFE